MDTIVKHGLLIIRDGKFLVNREHGTAHFLMPGGKPKEGESATQCLAREIREEHGCDVVPESITLFGNFEDVAINDPGKMISMQLFVGEIRGEPAPHTEIEEQKWFGKDDDQSTLSPLIKDKILPAALARGLLDWR